MLLPWCLEENTLNIINHEIILSDNYSCFLVCVL